MSIENNVENKINVMEKQIIDLQEKITKLEGFILNNSYNNNNNYNNNYNNDYNYEYNIKNEVNLDNIVCNRSINFSEPKLMRQRAFMFTRP
jgi:hypothetical protein